MHKNLKDGAAFFINASTLAGSEPASCGGDVDAEVDAMFCCVRVGVEGRRGEMWLVLVCRTVPRAGGEGGLRAFLLL